MVCLSALLFGARSVPGKQWIGKYRKVLKMTATRKKNQKGREAKINEVMSLLSRPYLTQEEELLHAKQRRDRYVPRFIRESEKKWMRKKTEVFPELKRIAAAHRPR